ncbi:hypothetical protein W911_16040 [Hyphomicrobium nitrativorans NL23]|uniref:Uncharacterized protein n=1 Tax=Hyphomicrobium nitrativorans NL23 TaxID=1029756 RepID=V5SIN3_9HYPH|nr:hypothetical protein [Hyphomicrobium nitrativorans]AHB50398.1 hypothetical protein W911_16040 [Hyphomicrobium nitrativorans NL23]
MLDSAEPSGTGATPRPAASAGKAPVIVTVHGTNDAALDDTGERWWQTGSTFTNRLAERLAARGIPQPEIVPVHWSGKNSDHDRLKGAEALARTLRGLHREGRQHAVLAHSHGGNVAVEGLARARPSAQRGAIISFGTPFFVRKLKTVPRLIALFQLVLGLVIPPIMLWYLIEVLPGDSNKKIEAVVLFSGLFALGVWSLIAGVRKLARRHLAERRFARSLSPSQWLVVHSPRDEAMQLLETAAEINPEYVTTASAMRSLTAFASLAGVIATVAFFVWTGSYFLTPILEKVREGTYGLALGADLTFLLLVPVIYGAVFFAIWLAARAGGAWAYAKFLTSAIHGGVVGAAFGGDDAFKLVGVTRLPPYLVQGREERIEAIDLGGIDDAALFVAAQSLYNSVVANDGPDGGIANPDAMWKRLSDALYHNAYMRDDNVIETVAEHIAATWRQTA